MSIQLITDGRNGRDERVILWRLGDYTYELEIGTGLYKKNIKFHGENFPGFWIPCLFFWRIIRLEINVHLYIEYFKKIYMQKWKVQNWFSRTKVKKKKINI